MFEILTGRTKDHLLDMGGGLLAHKQAASSLQPLISAAAESGIELAVCSSFRSFEDQIRIWNGKALGQRAVYGDEGEVIDLSALEESARVLAIARWSAIPGGSRHHWGTDFDVYDSAAVGDDYRLKLSPDEYAETGPFHKLNQWLLDNSSKFGFSLPYAKDLGGVHPEPWHISFKPVAEELLQHYSLDIFKQHLSSADFELIAAVRSQMAMLHQKFIQNIC